MMSSGLLTSNEETIFLSSDRSEHVYQLDAKDTPGPGSRTHSGKLNITFPFISDPLRSTITVGKN